MSQVKPDQALISCATIPTQTVDGHAEQCMFFHASDLIFKSSIYIFHILNACTAPMIDCVLHLCITAHMVLNWTHTVENRLR